MGDPIFSDDEIMAYADGELPEARVSELDLALAGDTDLAARLTVFTETRLQVSAAYEPMLDEPVPDHLVRHIRDLAARAGTTTVPDNPDNIIPLRAKPGSPAPQRLPFWQMPLAASIALGVGLGIGLFMGREDHPSGGIEVAALNDPEISGALVSLASGESRRLANGARIALIATFRDGSAALWREFAYDQVGGSTLVSVACNDGTGWDVKLAIAAPASGETGYAPASSLETLDAYLTATGAQAPLFPQDEARALTSLR